MMIWTISIDNHFDDRSLKVLKWLNWDQTTMTDYSSAIIALVVVGIVFTVAVVYVLIQPSDLPSQNKDK